jgi:hypothetical protein
MLERKRARKGYVNVATDDQDVELGEGLGVGASHDDLGQQESGVISAVPVHSLDEELDNWDENAEDNWDDDEPTTGTDSAGEGLKTPPSTSSTGEAEAEPEVKKRVD